MIIKCSNCGTQYQINPALRGVTLKSGSCMVCGEPLPPPIDLEKSQESKRRHDREKLHIRSTLFMNPDKREIHGVTFDISAGGVYLQTLNPPEDEKIKMGETGIFVMVMHESTPPATCEFYAEVVRIVEEGIGLRFIHEEERHPTSQAIAALAQTLPQPFSKVYVRRSNGCLEGDWEIAPPRTKLPEAIYRVLLERKQSTLCVVCRKRLSAGDSYKIYTVKELREIQAEVEVQRLAISRIKHLTGEDDLSQTRRF